MKRTRRFLVSALIILLCAGIGWWLVRDLSTRFKPEPRERQAVEAVRERPRAVDVPPPRTRAGPRRDRFPDGTSVEMMASYKPRETILRFPSDESYGAFLHTLASSRVRVVERLDRMRALRLGYDQSADLSELLAGENITAYPALSTTPAPTTEHAVQEAALSFHENVLPWLGVTGDNSRWGAGVKIAVLDSGIAPHEAVPGLSTSIEVIPYDGDAQDSHGHGTAVASLIAGNHPLARGIAPAAELVSVRVTTDHGVSDSFAIASGILAAIDEGAHILNLSLGSYENSPLMEEAILMAMQEGIAVVAASGNEAQSDARYPAAYPGVISVGSVDARGLQLGFSNYGDYLTLTAPGLALNAAWPGGKFIRMTGTSASAPLVAGAIAAVMSDGRGGAMITPQEAVEIITAHANEAGLPGPDSEYGFGILDIGRVMNRHQPGRMDAAITDQRLSRDSSGRTEILVTIQNRGTSTLVNALLETTSPAGTYRANLTTLAPGAIHTFRIPYNPASLAPGTVPRVSSTLTLGTNVPDLTPENNRRTDILR